MADPFEPPSKAAQIAEITDLLIENTDYAEADISETAWEEYVDPEKPVSVNYKAVREVLGSTV